MGNLAFHFTSSLPSRYSLATVDSHLGESGYSLGRGETIVGRNTLQRIPEEVNSEGGLGGWSPPAWPLKENEEMLVRPGEIFNRTEDFPKIPENLSSGKSEQRQNSVFEVYEDEGELGLSHLILHTKETFIA